MGVVERIWYGDGLSERLARGVLTPAAWVYGGATAVRNALYDHGLLFSRPMVTPVMSIGNLSVGGTGKTPVAAWAAAALAARGGRPAILLRGYGADEPLVHAALNPTVPVIVNPDRVRGTLDAHMAGADCVVLDDAFQHRRIHRVADWVLVSAEQWRDGAARLPAGPLREGERALRRATLVIVTRKTAPLEQAAALAARLAVHVPGGGAAVIHLAPRDLVHAMSGVSVPLERAAGRRYLAVAAIGMPGAFFDQLRAAGLEIDDVAFRDHHRFTQADALDLQRRAEGRDGVICTLKDAVKLREHWRGAETPLWYVSQAATVDRGGPRLDDSLAAVLAARPPFRLPVSPAE